MPSTEHEVPLEFFRNRPELAALIAREVFGLDVPEGLCWRLGPETVTNLVPTELSLDVALVGDNSERPRHAIVHEVQRDASETSLGRISLSWPTYVTHLRQRFRCPVRLLAFCPTAAIAEKVGQPIETGHPEFDLKPLVYWPAKLPPVTDPARARAYPELVFLSAGAHADGPDGEKVLRAVNEAIAVTRGDELGPLYNDYVLAQLSKAARSTLEEILAASPYQYQSDFARRYFGEGEAKGKAEGEAEALLRVLAARRINVPEDVRARITACTDSDQLETWIDRAATATTLDDIFD